MTAVVRRVGGRAGDCAQARVGESPSAQARVHLWGQELAGRDWAG